MVSAVPTLESERVREDPIIARLRKGETVTRRGRGNSMTPRIKSGEKQTLAPVDPETLEVGDAVFCRVRSMVVTHLLTAIRVGKKGKEFQISNNHGHVNGWIGPDCIYGKLVAVERWPTPYNEPRVISVRRWPASFSGGATNASLLSCSS